MSKSRRLNFGIQCVFGDGWGDRERICGRSHSLGCAPGTGRLCYQTPHHSCRTRVSVQLLDKVYKDLLQKSCFCWLTWQNCRLGCGQLLRKRLSLKKDWDVHSSGVCHENWADGSFTKAFMAKLHLLFLDAGFSDQPCSLSRSQLY